MIHDLDKPPRSREAVALDLARRAMREAYCHLLDGNEHLAEDAIRAGLEAVDTLVPPKDRQR